MTKLSKLQRAPLLHQSVQEALKDYVVRSDLAPGDPLPAEAELARQLGVSRNSVREAVKALETVGILESRRGSGVFVGRFSFGPLLDALPYGLMAETKDMADLLDVRGALEVAMIERAIRLRTPEQLEALNEVLAAMRDRAEAKEDISREDREFHRILFMNLGNAVLMRLIDVFWQSFHRAARHHDLVNQRPLDTYRDHAAIVDAFVRGDAAAAKATLDRHYDGIRALLKGGDAASSGSATTSD